MSSSPRFAINLLCDFEQVKDLELKRALKNT